MTIPGDWYVFSSQDLLRLLMKESPGAGYSQQSLKQSGVSYLLSISRYQPAQRGPRGEFNPNMVIHAWDLSRLPGIKTAKDYIELMKNRMKAIGVTPRSDPHPVQLGGVQFWRVDGTSRSPEFKSLAHIATIRKGYALDFQPTTGSKTERTKLKDVLKSLHFE
jgi:hypothetical protein